MSEKLVKPKCPICESDIELIVISINAGSSSDVSLLGGSYETAQYKCKLDAGICDLADTMYQAVTNQTTQINIPRSGDNTTKKQHQSMYWRLALSEYFKYIDFCVDNEVSNKIWAYTNDKGVISNKDRNFLINMYRNLNKTA